MVKILIADIVSSKVIETLKLNGHDVHYDPNITEKTLPNEIKDFSILIVRSKKVTSETINSSMCLSLIIRAGAGVDTIDIKAASLKGIIVSNTPGMNGDAVAELTFGHIIACDRLITTNTEYLRKGQWKKKLFLECEGLKDRTIVLVGRGKVAQSMIRIAKGFQMKVIVWCLRLTLEEATQMGVEYAKNLNDIAIKSDIVSVHVAYDKNITHHLIDTEFFNLMKNGAIFINTARGEIVNTISLRNAIKEKNLKVGLDVFENEPNTSISDFPFSDLAKECVSVTSHIGGSTNQASERISDECIRIINHFVQTGEALNNVNVINKPVANILMIVRHLCVFSKIINCCEKNNVKFSSCKNDVIDGENAQITLLKLISNTNFEKEILEIEGVLGVSTIKLD